MANSSYAVPKTTARGRLGPSAATTSKPLPSGIWTSRKSRSGRARSTAAIVSRPVALSPTISTSACGSSRARMRRRAGGSSSAITTRRGGGGGPGSRRVRPAKGDRDRRHGTALVGAPHLEGVALAVELHEPRAGVRQPHAAARHVTRSGGKSHTVVAHLEAQQAVVAPGRDAHHARRAARRDAVAHRVLHQRLQQEVRDTRIERGGVDVPGDAEAVLEAGLLDLEVRRHEAQL